MKKSDINAEKKTAAWLKANGINPKQLTKDEMWLLQSQKNAHLLLKRHIDALTEAEQSTVMDFALMMTNSQQRLAITKRMSYEILNISKKVRRKIFKAQRQS